MLDQTGGKNSFSLDYLLRTHKGPTGTVEKLRNINYLVDHARAVIRELVREGVERRERGSRGMSRTGAGTEFGPGECVIFEVKGRCL